MRIYSYSIYINKYFFRFYNLLKYQAKILLKNKWNYISNLK